MNNNLFIARASVAVAQLIAGCTQDSAVFQDPVQSTLLFLSYRDGNGEIYSLTPGDSVPTNLTQNPAYDGFGKWSPNGDKIVFDSDRGQDGNRDIYVMHSDGSNVNRLTNHPSFDLLPSWSPDGSRIAFMSLRDSEWSPQNTGVAFSASIYTMNDDGTNVQRLTYAEAHEQSPTWSPDGNTIMFSREVDGLGQLFTIDLQNNTERRFWTSTTYDASPTFSPDGNQIAFYATQGDTAHIWIASVDGTEERQVTHRFQENYEAGWSPDGSAICYSVGVDDQWDIYATDLTTGREYPLITDEARDQACNWGIQRGEPH